MREWIEIRLTAHSEWSGSCDTDPFGVSSGEYENRLGTIVVGQSVDSARNSGKFSGPWGCTSYDERASWWGSTRCPQSSLTESQPDA